ncbi:hypothetical protein KIN20_010079 [Parelaphostrongylus tenuis]|uniref:Uncharacterized protein n=1 Tax=Parelaphostrongylus tenuis TaxID=148309 RepID=A0AAD5MC14_PARTN|nr:hypothetical protein KIN20_010079 [Parelaphostrongylus tenuis]
MSTVQQAEALVELYPTVHNISHVHRNEHEVIYDTSRALERTEVKEREKRGGREEKEEKKTRKKERKKVNPRQHWKVLYAIDQMSQRPD